MDRCSLELLALLQKRAEGLARHNWGHVASDGTWTRGTDSRSDEERIAEEGEFVAVCRIIDRYVSYSDGDSASFYLLTTRAKYGES